MNAMDIKTRKSVTVNSSLKDNPVDLPVVAERKNMLRRDWVTREKVAVGMDHMSRAFMQNTSPINAYRMQIVRRKIDNFTKSAVFPQQLTIPRQYATTQEGVFIYKVLEDREIDRVAGGGVRVVVQENAAQARFYISPLFSSKHDALDWARLNTGATI